jgi:hypothetical protein
MMASLFDAVFGCWHKNCSFPMTMRPGRSRCAAASVSGMYVVCLDCGREFPYDWATMKVVSPSSKAAHRIAETASVLLAVFLPWARKPASLDPNSESALLSPK